MATPVSSTRGTTAVGRAAVSERSKRGKRSDCRWVVEQLSVWYERHRTDLDARGIDARFERSPNDGRPKTSAWLTLQRGETAGEIVVWAGGECELWGPVREEALPGTDAQGEHRQLVSDSDLSAAVARVLALFD